MKDNPLAVFFIFLSIPVIFSITVIAWPWVVVLAEKSKKAASKWGGK